VKWAGLLALLAATLPLAPQLRSNPRLTYRVWTFLGFLPFVMESIHFYMSAVLWEDWPGFTKGIELTVLDALALSVYFGLPRAADPLPFRIAIALYFLSTLLSALPAIVPVATLFYCWQLARIFLFYAVIVRASADPLVPVALLKGMAAGLVLEAAVVLWQRFGLGMLQTPGTMNHQNELGMLSHFIVFPFFALLLSGRAGWLPAVVLPAGAIVELMTTSRGTIALAAAGYLAVFALSIMRGWTARKGLILAIFVGGAAAIAPIAISAIAARGTQEIEGSDSSRVALEAAASMMLTEHPMGVGANNFTLAANAKGYYQRAGVPYSDYQAFVHNVYWLTAAENGYFGLITFVGLLLSPLLVAFQCGMRHRNDIRGDLLIGLGVAVLAVYIQSLEEWVFITYRLQYVYVMDIGLIAGLAMQMGFWRRGAPARLTTLRDAVSQPST
jgi:O-antigen ligase